MSNSRGMGKTVIGIILGVIAVIAIFYFILLITA